MQVILPLIYSVFFILLIYKMKFFAVPDLSRKTVASLFVLKIIAGIALFFLYTYYYSDGDFKLFFEDGDKLFYLLTHDLDHFKEILFKGDARLELKTWDACFENTLYNDSRTMVMLNLLFRFFSFGNFYVHTVFMCFLSLIGLTAIFKTFRIYFNDSHNLLFLCVFLLPSVLFWSSGVLKEGLLFFGMGVLLYTTKCGLETKYSFSKVLLIMLSISVLLFVKFYILIALTPGLFANYWIANSSNRAVLVKYISSYFIFLFLILLISILKPNLDPVKIIVNKQEKSEAVAKGGVFLLSNTHFIRIEFDQKKEILIPVDTNTFQIKLNSSYDEWKITNLKDTIHISNSIDTSLFKIMYEVMPPKSSIASLKLKPTIFSLLKNSPKAFINTLTTPVDFSGKDRLKFLASLENIFYLICFLLLIVFFRRPVENKEILYFCLSFCALIFILAGLTTPIVGALVRYRTPALPFMMIFIFMLVDKNKIKKIPFFGKYLID